MSKATWATGQVLALDRVALLAGRRDDDDVDLPFGEQSVDVGERERHLLSCVRQRATDGVLRLDNEVFARERLHGDGAPAVLHHDALHRSRFWPHHGP
jgi:hypothetical protein